MVICNVSGFLQAGINYYNITQLSMIHDKVQACQVKPNESPHGSTDMHDVLALIPVKLLPSYRCIAHY